MSVSVIVGVKSVHSRHELEHNEARSCGCLAKEILIARSTKFHSELDRALNTRYKTVWRRCYDKKQKTYLEYGAKGIKMCPQWENPLYGKDLFIEWAKLNGFEPGKNLTVERDDINLDYSPDNCRIIPMKDQALNRSVSRWITICGMKKLISHWGPYLGHTNSYVHSIIKNHGEEDVMRILQQKVEDKLKQERKKE